MFILKAYNATTRSYLQLKNAYNNHKMQTKIKMQALKTKRHTI